MKVHHETDLWYYFDVVLSAQVQFIFVSGPAFLRWRLGFMHFSWFQQYCRKISFIRKQVGNFCLSLYAVCRGWVGLSPYTDSLHCAGCKRHKRHNAAGVTLSSAWFYQAFGRFDLKTSSNFWGSTPGLWFLEKFWSFPPRKKNHRTDDTDPDIW